MTDQKKKFWDIGRVHFHSLYQRLDVICCEYVCNRVSMIKQKQQEVE